MFRHLLSAVLLAGVSVAAHGHEVWVNAAHTHGGEVLKAELGYGHYPELEPIAADRLTLFPKPLQLLTPQGKIDLVRRGQHNYQFETPRAVADGSYLLLAQYRPTFWSRNAAGWQRQNLTQMKDATYCEQTSMFGKAVVNVGHESASKDQPAGRRFAGDCAAGKSGQCAGGRGVAGAGVVPWRAAAGCHGGGHV